MEFNGTLYGSLDDYDDTRDGKGIQDMFQVLIEAKDDKELKRFYKDGLKVKIVVEK